MEGQGRIGEVVRLYEKGPQGRRIGWRRREADGTVREVSRTLPKDAPLGRLTWAYRALRAEFSDRYE